MSELVNIKQFKDKYFIFQAKDAEKTRCQYRIVGALNGTLSQFPLQNTFFGLPLGLLPEEVMLLEDKGWAKMNSNFKSDSKLMLRYQIFKYYWSKGFYLTSGIKFGGDYLLYSNDPMCVHSAYIVSIQDSIHESIEPLDLINMGRLATTVKKTFVIASFDNGISQYSIEWAGF